MDDGLLIEQVEKFKHLYDKQNSSFKNKLARENAWKSIGHILETQAEHCEQRWNVLRNEYAALKRQVKHTSSGSQLFTISWPYFDCMKFLDPYIHSRVKRISSIKQNTNSQSYHPQSDQWPGMYNILSPESIPDDLDSLQIEIDEELENITSEITPNAPNIQTRRKNENNEEKPKKNTSGAVAESMSLALTSLSDSLSSYVPNNTITSVRGRRNIHMG